MYICLIKLKQRPMTTLKTLKNELEQAKLNIKIFNACETIVDAFVNKESFKFESLSGEKTLFTDTTFYSCGSLSTTLNDVKHFEDMQKINFDKLIVDTKKIKAAIKLIETELKKETSICHTILNNMPAKQTLKQTLI